MEQAAQVAAEKLRQLASAAQSAAQSVIDGGRNKYFTTNKKGLFYHSTLPISKNFYSHFR